MEEEEQVNIIKIITTVDDDKSYSIDVDETTTFYGFKKILIAAAHLLKNCFRIYHDSQEYTSDYDDNTIKELFPGINPLPLRIVSDKDINEFEEELISVRFNIQVPCDSHIGKYKMLYCFTCSRSICMDCFNQDHKTHNVEEKADYLAPAKLLMNHIFSNSSLYKADSRLSKYMDCVSFRSNLKLNIFDNLRKLINDLELKFASCLEYFSTSEDETEKNTNENLELLKQYCIECYIKLKNDINTKGIIIDDEIFLTFYNKLKEIERYKTEYFEENKQKYEKLNTLLAPFIKQVERISDELKITFDNYLNKDIYDKFRSAIQENIVEKIQKEQVNDLMFRNLGVPRKSLNRMSLGNLSSYKVTQKNTSFNSPNRYLANKMNEVNPFKRAMYSPQPEQQGSGSESLLGNITSSNAKNGKQNYAYTYTKNEQKNIKTTGLPSISENSGLKGEENRIYENKKVVTSTTTTTNVNNMNLNDINNIGGNKVTTVRGTEETINTIVSNNLGNKTTAVQGMKSILNNNIGPTNLNMDLNTINESNMISRNNINTVNESNMISRNNVNTVSESNMISINNVNTMNESNMNISRNNLNNIASNSSSINNFGTVGNIQNIQKETTVYNTNETTFPTTSTNYNQKEYIQTTTTNVPNINIDSQAQNNITKVQATTTTITTNNLNEQNRSLNSNINVNAIGAMNSNLNNNINKTYSQGYEVTKYTTTNQQQIQQSGTQQVGNISNATFPQLKLVDVLNNEINKNDLEYQEKMKNKNLIKETHSEHIFGNNGTYIQNVIQTNTIEYGNLTESVFLFMYPIFNTNKLSGAFEDESTGTVELDFKQAFGEKDIQLNEFPQGGAFCNSGKYLYITGGQEKQKGIGKMFLRVSILKSEFSEFIARLVKMPSMINSHWNHSMISNDDYIFVVGGYNSNKCEYFNLKTMKWEVMPDLNSEERQRPILIINEGYLYAFMGYTQYNILDSVERININKLGTSKWEKLAFTNPDNINLKFYGAGLYKYNGKLYFIGGKIGQGTDDSDYKSEIYCFDFDNMKFSGTDTYYNGQLNFIENQFHHCNLENIGNFIDANEGFLTIIAISALPNKK